MEEAADTETAASPLEPESRGRTWIPAVVLWGLALATGTVVLSVDPHSIAAHLLVGVVDASGLQYVGYLTAAAILAAALFATTYWYGGGEASDWRRVTASMLALGLSLVLLLLAYPVLLLGTLVFSSDYRTIGTVDGRELIVERRVGLGQFPIAAGLRNGLSVDFSSTSDTWTDGSTALNAMRFHTQDNGDTITITYRPGPRSGQAFGVITLSK